mgnify:CR=1 FL=1
MLTAKILFIILLALTFYGFGTSALRNHEEQIKNLEDKVKVLSEDVQIKVMSLTKIFVGFVIMIQVAIAWISIALLKDNWLSLIPIICFILSNLDLSIFKCQTIRDYIKIFREQKHRLYTYEIIRFISLIIWYGIMIVFC